MLQIDRSLEESAQMCGASWGHRLRTVTMPLLKPGLIAAWLLLIAYLTVFLPLGLRTIAGVMLQIDRSLEESAQMCGASWGHRLRTVTMPLLKPGLVAAWLLLFIASVRELGASILLMGPKAKVITPAIVESWFSTSSELTAAMALLQTLAVAVALAILFTVARRAVQTGGE